jgi:hypothetical protein
MKQGPIWEALARPTRQEISRLLWHQKNVYNIVRFRVVSSGEYEDDGFLGYRII